METHEETFDAQAEVARIRSRRAVARRKHYRKSRLDRYRAELVAMRRAGASCADLVTDRPNGAGDDRVNGARRTW